MKKKLTKDLVMEYSTALKSLSQINLNKIRTVFEEIDNEFQIKQSPKIIIPFLPSNYKPRPAQEKITPEYTEYEGIEIKKRTDGLNFLKNQGIIERYNVDTFHYRQDGNTEYHIEIKLNIDNFLNFKSSWKRIEEPETKSETEDMEGELLKLKPEIYGIGIDLKKLWSLIKKKFKRNTF